MPQKDELLFLYNYNTWADGVVLDAACHLTPEQIQAKHGMGFGPIFETLAHIMWAQQVWLSRWRGVPPVSPSDFSTPHDLVELAAEWEKVHADLNRFIENLNPAQYSQKVSYNNFQGGHYTHPLYYLMMHLINHSTEHRAQVAAMCTMAGHDVGSLDMIHYIRTVMPSNA